MGARENFAWQSPPPGVALPPHEPRAGGLMRRAAFLTTAVATLGAAVGVAWLAWRWLGIPRAAGGLVAAAVGVLSARRGLVALAPTNLSNGVVACLALGALSAVLGRFAHPAAAVLATLAILAATGGAFWLYGQALRRLHEAPEHDREDRGRLVSAGFLLAVAALLTAALGPFAVMIGLTEDRKSVV